MGGLLAIFPSCRHDQTADWPHMLMGVTQVNSGALCAREEHAPNPPLLYVIPPPPLRGLHARCMRTQGQPMPAPASSPQCFAALLLPPERLLSEHGPVSHVNSRPKQHVTVTLAALYLNVALITPAGAARLLPARLQRRRRQSAAQFTDHARHCMGLHSPLLAAASLLASASLLVSCLAGHQAAP